MFPVNANGEVRFLSCLLYTSGSRGLISTILWWMWFGNTTLLLISGVLGIDPGLFEAADIDGATGWKKFRYITLPPVSYTHLDVYKRQVTGQIIAAIAGVIVNMKLNKMCIRDRSIPLACFM